MPFAQATPPSAGRGGGMPFAMGGETGFQVGYKVRMQGIPFSVTESDIAEWFSSLVDPVKVRINYNSDGKPSGNADVLFSTHEDAQKAMTKHKENMQHRYVELYYDGQVMAPGVGGPGGIGVSSSPAAGLGRGMGMGIGRGFGGQGGMGFGNGMSGLGGNYGMN